MSESIRLLVRPTKGTVVGGVAAAIAERFGLNVFLLRLLFLAAMNASELSIGIYILLWLSIPKDRSVIGLMRTAGTEPVSFSDRVLRSFESLGIHSGVSSAVASIPIGLSILLFAVCLQFTKLNALDPFRAAPFIGVLASVLTRLSSAFFYGVCGLLFIFRTRHERDPLILTQRREASLKLDTTERRALFGLISGIGAELGIDPGVLRPVAILANVFTLGGAGAVYLLAALIVKRKKVGLQAAEAQEIEAGLRKPFCFPRISSLMIGVLFMLLGIVRLATEYRFFFFNEGFAVGLVLCMIGAITTAGSLRSVASSSTARMLLIASTSIILYGLYELLTVLYYVQLPFAARFELSFAIAALSFFYFGLTAERGKPAGLAFVVGGLLLLGALSFQFNLLSSRFVLAIVEFYLYFYPILYGTAGLWLMIGANGGKGFRYLPKWLELSERRTMNLPDQPLPQ